jgi:hypothetical protein
VLSKHIKSLAKRGVGQGLVEFALILPLIVLIVAGILDLGRAFFVSITITNSARSGARYGTVHVADTDPPYTQTICNTTVEEAKLSNIPITYSDVEISCGTPVTCVNPYPYPLPITPSSGCTHNQSIIVSVDYLYDDMIFKFFFPSGIQMQRSIEMFIP